MKHREFTVNKTFIQIGVVGVFVASIAAYTMEQNQVITVETAQGLAKNFDKTKLADAEQQQIRATILDFIDVKIRDGIKDDKERQNLIDLANAIGASDTVRHLQNRHEVEI